MLFLPLSQSSLSHSNSAKIQKSMSQRQHSSNFFCLSQTLRHHPEWHSVGSDNDAPVGVLPPLLATWAPAVFWLCPEGVPESQGGHTQPPQSLEHLQKTENCLFRVWAHLRHSESWVGHTQPPGSQNTLWRGKGVALGWHTFQLRLCPIGIHFKNWSYENKTLLWKRPLDICRNIRGSPFLEVKFLIPHLINLVTPLQGSKVPSFE